MEKVIAIAVFTMMLPITAISIFFSEISRAVSNFCFTSRMKSEISKFSEIFKSL